MKLTPRTLSLLAILVILAAVAVWWNLNQNAFTASDPALDAVAVQVNGAPITYGDINPPNAPADPAVREQMRATRLREAVVRALTDQAITLYNPQVTIDEVRALATTQAAAIDLENVRARREAMAAALRAITQEGVSAAQAYNEHLAAIDFPVDQWEVLAANPPPEAEIAALTANLPANEAELVETLTPAARQQLERQRMIALVLEEERDGGATGTDDEIWNAWLIAQIKAADFVLADDPALRDLLRRAFTDPAAGPPPADG